MFILIFLSFFLPYSLSEEWTIHVHTGTKPYAGTDSNIFIRMFNSIHGYTDEYELSHENWLYGNALYPLKNLFESGGHDRFRITTEKFRFVETIYITEKGSREVIYAFDQSASRYFNHNGGDQVRRERFPLIRSDWFLDRIIVERNRDSVKFLFVCNCWLYTNQLSQTLTLSSDLRTIEKNNPEKDNQTIVLILIVSIALSACLICCLYKKFRRREFQPVPTGYESTIIARCYPASAPPCLYDSRSLWGRVEHTLPPMYDAQPVDERPVNNNQPTGELSVNNSQSTGELPINNSQSTDQPPAYRDLFPD